MNRLKILGTILIGATMVHAALPLPQNSASSPSLEQSVDEEVALMRKDVRSDKRQIIAANMRLTDQEAQNFWPVYDNYSKDLMKINDEKYQLIKRYAKNLDATSDDRLDQTVKDWLKLDQSATQLRVKYLPMFRSVIPAKSVARFYQLDKRIGNLIELQLASELPLVQP
jgi:hypothetical protein